MQDTKTQVENIYQSSRMRREICLKEKECNVTK